MEKYTKRENLHRSVASDFQKHSKSSNPSKIFTTKDIGNIFSQKMPNSNLLKHKRLQQFPNNMYFRSYHKNFPSIQLQKMRTKEVPEIIKKNNTNAPFLVVKSNTIPIQKKDVIQRSYKNENGVILTDEQYATIKSLITNYDNANEGQDVNATTGSMNSLDDRTINLNVALFALEDYLEKLAPTPKQSIAIMRCIWGVTDQHEGNLHTALQTARSGRECNNAIARWFTACMESFEHESDD